MLRSESGTERVLYKLIVQGAHVTEGGHQAWEGDPSCQGSSDLETDTR